MAHPDQAVASILRATSFAAEKHRNQRRKDIESSPYINHPIGLANVLAVEAGVHDVAVLSAALLHDTIEDTDTTAEELMTGFGDEVARIVLEVTDNKSLPKEERKQHQIDHAQHLSPKARLVKLADKICNLRDLANAPPADWSLERRREYYDWAKKVIDGFRGTHPRLEQLFDAEYIRRP